MTPKKRICWPLAVATAAVALLSCSRSTDNLRPSLLSTDPVVFTDAGSFAAIDWQPFLGAKLDALELDDVELVSGTESMKFHVPAPGDPSGAYAGGAIVARTPRDLSSYNAVTFWARASEIVTLDLAGLGNDNTGTSKFWALWGSIPLTTVWTQWTLPIPVAGKLEVESGLFFFAEGAQGQTPYNIWFDDIHFSNVTTISNPRPTIRSQLVGAFVGTSLELLDASTTFSVAYPTGTLDQRLDHGASYFTFTSSDSSVVKPENSELKVVGGGTALLTATLGGLPVVGSVFVDAKVPPMAPPRPPTVPASQVISLFSNVYPNRTVDTWSAAWDQADVADLAIAGDDIKAYSNLSFAGIEFTSQPIDATAMTHFHLDAFAADGAQLRVKLVDFGPNGIFGGGDDSEHEVTLTPATIPALAVGAWASLDIPLSDFVNLTGRTNVAQLVLSGAVNTVYIDNIYFHN